ncbi:hypothetical protein Aasi_1878 [Candidatus Amoebophilus asiaticus 5a2]|uniref:Uncharacterized protein n=2 Tax=Candidatus Amoebophilus asiaticus TaxID=281120 RepID=C3L469_AMOA5|nr:hypothetical protein Aasi_1878 [Candidatus Amoebophilus asiaticus 5a2]
MSLVAVSCKDCNNGNPAHTPNPDIEDTKPVYQLILDGIGASASLEGIETYSFFIVNNDNQNTVPSDEILLSLESEIEFTLNNYSVDSQGLTLKKILEVDKIKPSAPQEVILKLKNAKDRNVAASIKLQLKDKTGNKIGEEKSLVWRPKVGIQLDLQITNKNLKGNEKENKKIEFKVASLGTIMPDKDAISLNLIPEDGITATIVGASQATVNGKIIYTYQVKKEDINKTITSLSIDPQGSKQASFKVQLVYDGNLVGPEQTLTWQADEPLAFAFEASEEKYKDIVTGMKSLIGTDIVEISIKNLGKDTEDDEVLLCVEQDSPVEEIAFEVYYNYQNVDQIGAGTPSIAFKSQKKVDVELLNLSNDGTAIKKGDTIKIALQLIDPKVKQQASITFKMKSKKDNQDIATPVTINWRAVTTTSKSIEVTQQMLNEIFSKPGCRRLYDVLKDIKDGKVGQELDINKTDSHHRLGYTALLEAINIGREDIVTLLLDKGADVNTPSIQGETPIQVAIRKLDVEIVNLLLEQKKLDSNITYEKGKKLLLNLAIESKNVTGDIEEVTKIADMLLDKLDIDTIIRINGSGQESPILLAIQCRRTQLVKKLLAKGFTPDLKNKQGETAIHLVARYNQRELAEQLIARNVELDVRDNIGNTPLHIAAALPKNKEIAKLLIDKFQEKGISLDLVNQLGQTPLHKIAGNSNAENIEIMENLLQAGAQPNVQDKNGSTPLHYAIGAKYRNIIEELIRAGTQMDIQDNQGNTSLHLLVANNYVDIVRSVIAKSPNLKNIKNKADKLPKDLATTPEMKALFN